MPLPSASSAIDAEHTIETFGARLRNEVELDALASGLVAVVDRTMTPAHVSLDHPGATDMTTEGLTRRKRRLRVRAWVLLAFTIGLIVASEILGRVSDTPPDGGWLEELLLMGAFTVFPVMGVLIAQRRPDNLIVWLMM